MLQSGILLSLIVSGLWITLQLFWVRLKPSVDRFKSMCVGYAASLLPLAGLLYLSGAQGWFGCHAETLALTAFHAFLLETLIFFFYVEFFYHIERSVTLRILVELLLREESGSSGTKPLQALQAEYSQSEMIRRRLEVLREKGFIQQVDGRWMNLPKGQLLARIMQLSSWIFQSKSQAERE